MIGYLFFISYRAFQLPDKTANGPFLTSKVKSNINLDSSNFSWNENRKHHLPKQSDPKPSYAKRAISRLEDRDILGAVRILSSVESFAFFDASTLEYLHLKHSSCKLPLSIFLLFLFPI